MEAAQELFHSVASHAQEFFRLIEYYTGLSPVIFFTACALLVGAYYLIAGVLAPPQISGLSGFGRVPSTPDLRIGEISLEDLRQYDGKDPKKPLLMAIRGQVYDVSSARGFYGPGGPYAAFAGRDASRALAKMSFEEKDLTGNLEVLSTQELEVLNDWESKFVGKYAKVGQVMHLSKEKEVTGQKDTTKDENEKREKEITPDEGSVQSTRSSVENPEAAGEEATSQVHPQVEEHEKSGDNIPETLHPEKEEAGAKSLNDTKPTVTDKGEEADSNVKVVEVQDASESSEDLAIKKPDVKLVQIEDGSPEHASRVSSESKEVSAA